MLLDDSWLGHLNVEIQNDIYLMAELGVLGEHAPEQSAGSPQDMMCGTEVPARCSQHGGQSDR